MNQLNMLKRRLYDADALAATNFKIAPGSNRDATAEQVAKEANRALSQLEAGEFEVVILG